MTVAELIAALSRCDLDAEVWMGHGRPWHHRVAVIETDVKDVRRVNHEAPFAGSASDIRFMTNQVRIRNPKIAGKHVFLNSVPRR